MCVRDQTYRVTTNLRCMQENVLRVPTLASSLKLASPPVSTCLPKLHHLLLLTAVATQASTHSLALGTSTPSASVTGTAPHPFSRQPSLQHPTRQHHCQHPPCGTRRSAALLLPPCACAMAMFGKFNCFCVATKGGDVIYERFYDRLSEAEKAEVRAAFFQASSGAGLVDDQDRSAAYRNARFVYIPYNDLVFYLLSTGEYDELAATEALRAIMTALSEVLGRTPSAGVLLDKYTRLALVVDEVINEGLLETLDPETIRRALKNKAMWE